MLAGVLQRVKNPLADCDCLGVCFRFGCWGAVHSDIEAEGAFARLAAFHEAALLFHVLWEFLVWVWVPHIIHSRSVGRPYRSKRGAGE